MNSIINQISSLEKLKMQSRARTEKINKMIVNFKAANNFKAGLITTFRGKKLSEPITEKEYNKLFSEYNKGLRRDKNRPRVQCDCGSSILKCNLDLHKTTGLHLKKIIAAKNRVVKAPQVNKNKAVNMCASQ